MVQRSQPLPHLKNIRAVSCLLFDEFALVGGFLNITSSAHDGKEEIVLYVMLYIRLGVQWLTGDGAIRRLKMQGLLNGEVTSDPREENKCSVQTFRYWDDHVI